jgi:hypothetical protein
VVLKNHSPVTLTRANLRLFAITRKLIFLLYRAYLDFNQ